MRLTSLLHLSSSRLPSGSRVAGGLRPCPDGMRREGWRREVNGERDERRTTRLTSVSVPSSCVHRASPFIVRSLPSSISLSLRSPLSRRAPRKESRPSHRLFSLRSEPSRRRGVGERSRSGRRPVRSPLRSLHLGPLAPLASVNRPPRYPTSLVSSTSLFSSYTTLSIPTLTLHPTSDPPRGGPSGPKIGRGEGVG